MVYLREATIGDMDILFKWANDPVVRANSFNTTPISYEEHQGWFSRVLDDPSVLQFILMDDSTPVGQIRLNLTENEAEIGYSIASERRGNGYGHSILRLIAEKVDVDYPQIEHLVARVKPGNQASLKLFESEDFDMKFYCFSKKIGGGYKI